jgi:hypothetical protein
MLVAEAESAVAAGEAHKATLLYREADRAYAAALGELKRLTEREADLMEPAFAELEMRLQPSDMRPHSEDIRKLAGEVAAALRRRNIRPFERTGFGKLTR